MGSFYEEKDDAWKIQEIALTIFILFTAIYYIHPNTTIYPILFTLTGIFIITYFIIGIIKFITTPNQDNLLQAIALITMLILIVPHGLELINTMLKIIGL